MSPLPRCSLESPVVSKWLQHVTPLSTRPMSIDHVLTRSAHITKDEGPTGTPYLARAMASHLLSVTNLDFTSDTAQICVLLVRDAGLALEVPGANMSDNVPVALAKVSNQVEQTWIFFRGVKGHCIMNYGTGTYLCGSKTRPEDVLVSSKLPEEWDLVRNGDGYILRSSNGSILVALGTSVLTPSLRSAGGDHTIWTTAVASSIPISNVSQPFTTSPQRANIMNHVKNALQALVTIVHVLEHPENDPSLEVMDLVYTEHDVAVLGARIRECAKNFYFANDTATRWFTGVETQLQAIVSDKKRAEDRLKTIEVDRAATQTRWSHLQDKVKEYEGIVASSQQAVDQSQKDYDAAQAEYQRAVDDIREQQRVDRRTCVGAIAKGARSRHMGDMLMMGYLTKRDRAKSLMAEKRTKLDGDKQALNTFRKQLDTEKKSMEKLQLQLDAVQRESSAISARISPMQRELNLLSTLSAKINDCVHTMDYVLTRANALVIAETVSDLKVNIQEAADQLGADKDTMNALSALDADRLRKLGDRARTLSKQIKDGKIRSKL